MSFSKRTFRAACIALLVMGMAACGGGGGDGNVVAGTGAVLPTTEPLTTTTIPGPDNVLSVTVDSGPNGNAVNTLYATVTICQPNSTTYCQTIDHVLVDTGSTGLRLLSSVMASGLNLSRTPSASGPPLLNCAQFLDYSFAWGPVATADVFLGGKKAARVPIQVIADPEFNHLVATCSSSSNDALNSVAALGAKGILGIGLFKEDCGSRCASTLGNGVYFTCTDMTCVSATASRASLGLQLQNPVPLFTSDNNGLLVKLPSVALAGAPTLSGSIVFGIRTQSNNQFTTGAVLKTTTGTITTVFAGKNLTNSFLDTGSNGLFFNSSTIPACGVGATGFFCPATLTDLSATLRGSNAVDATVSFSIDNAVALFSGNKNSVHPTLSGPIGDADEDLPIFDWGLPFFYGRPVFIGIEDQPSAIDTGPFYAF